MNCKPASQVSRSQHETGAHMKRSLMAALLTTAMLVAGSPAHAKPATATLLGITGKVLINAGNGFQSALPDTVLNQGYDVFVADSSSATIHFVAGNCNVLLAAGSVTRITDASMCQEAMLSEPMQKGMRGLIDDVVVTPVNGYVAPPPPPVGLGFMSQYFIAGSFLAIGTATIAWSAFRHDSPAPIPSSAP